jgi:molecular chaperone GrpE
MSEFAPPAVPEGAAGSGHQEALTPAQVEDLLAEFRAWLLQAPAAGTVTPPAEPPDLHTLLGQMTALRQEVNLQTRAARAQQEQGAEALRQLGAALEALRRREEEAEERAGRERDELLRPLLKALVDLHDALTLARREVQRVQDAMASALDALSAAPEPLPPATTSAAPPRRSFWSRLFGRGRDAQAVQAAEVRSLREQLQLQRQALGTPRQAAERVRQFLGSVVTGYTMSLQRVERALQQHDLEAIPSVGEPFDPETMEAVEVVSDPGRSATEVVAEVRRGYRWRDRVFRAAQVKVARP